MKKLLLLSFAVVSVMISQAQIKKGTILLGGNIGYSDQSSKSDATSQVPQTKISSFAIAPSFGRAIKDNLVLGVDVNYNRLKNEYQNDPSNSTVTNGFSAGVFLRKYKYLGSGFYIFGQSRLGFNYSHQNSEGTAGSLYKSDDYGAGFGFYPGVAFAISRHLQIETGFPNIAYVNYDHLKQTSAQTGQPGIRTTTNTFNIGSSLSNTYQLTVGLRCVIGG